jgi:hypothetical protein
VKERSYRAKVLSGQAGHEQLDKVPGRGEAVNDGSKTELSQTLEMRAPKTKAFEIRAGNKGSKIRSGNEDLK